MTSPYNFHLRDGEWEWSLLVCWMEPDRALGMILWESMVPRPRFLNPIAQEHRSRQHA